MQEHSFELNYRSYDSQTELNEQDAKLLELAREVAKKAYAPYSGFSVGSAVLLQNGQIVTGNNQENAAYPSGICAERVAMFYASSQFPGVKVLKVAVTAFSNRVPVNAPVAPCGSCRQVLSEYEKLYESDIELILQGNQGVIYVLKNVRSLLPLAFTSDDLG
jgi:cytidine deaminase